jgi:hypothetical protein
MSGNKNRGIELNERFKLFPEEIAADDPAVIIQYYRASFETFQRQLSEIQEEHDLTMKMMAVLAQKFGGMIQVDDADVRALPKDYSIELKFFPTTRVFVLTYHPPEGEKGV